MAIVSLTVCREAACSFPEEGVLGRALRVFVQEVIVVYVISQIFGAMTFARLFFPPAVRKITTCPKIVDFT